MKFAVCVIFVTIVRHIVPAWNESFEIWLSVFTWKKWVVLIKVSREKHVYLISSVFCSIVYEEENISQHAAPSYQNLIIQHMDIAEPLSTLKSLLELRLQCTLSDHQFYLQDTIEVQFVTDHLHIIVVYNLWQKIWYRESFDTESQLSSVDYMFYRNLFHLEFQCVEVKRIYGIWEYQY